MKYSFIKILLMAAASFFAATGIANNSSNSKPVLVIDRIEDSEQLAKKFRSSLESNDQAVNSLRASASGQFSATELEQLFALIPAPRDKIWIIDVRQESHGFINGIPISWYGTQNRANVYKTPDQISKQEQTLLNDLRSLKTVQIYQAIKLPNGDIEPGEEMIQVPHQVQTEEQLVTELGAHYKRFYVLDHHRPDDLEVQNFVKFIRTQITPDDWLHFHCRGGKGRSSTFLAMYDILRNAHNSSFEQIMQRQKNMGNINFEKVKNTPEKQWKERPATDRYKFLKKFYAYVRDPNGYTKQDWITWVQENKK